MAVIETKFGVGDVVYRAGTATEAKRHPCPDCLGARKWECKSPAGGVFEVDCPRCSSSYQANDALNLNYTVWAPTVRRLTIGQVRALSGGGADERGTEYMAHETGIGSGSLYYEGELFATEAEALAAAEVNAKIANTDRAGWVAKQYDKTARFCDYQLKDAVMAAAVSEAKEAERAGRDLIEDVREAEDISDVKSAVERWVQSREAAQ